MSRQILERQDDAEDDATAREVAELIHAANRPWPGLHRRELIERTIAPEEEDAQ